MTDTFAQLPDLEYGPAADAVAVTPSDSVNLTVFGRALYVGVGGNITVVMLAGTVVLFTAVPAGTVLPIRVRRVNATGTTATSIVSIW